MSDEHHKEDEQKGSTNEELKVLLEKVQRLEDTNQRILEESKSHKDKYRKLRDSVEAREKSDLEKTENWKELLDMEKNKNAQISERLKEFQKQSLQKDLNFQVASIAKDAHDIEDIIKSLPRDMIVIDDENLKISGVAEAVDFVREKKPYFFDNKRTSGMSYKRPNALSTELTEEEKSDLADKQWNDALMKGLI